MDIVPNNIEYTTINKSVKRRSRIVKSLICVSLLAFFVVIGLISNYNDKSAKITALEYENNQLREELNKTIANVNYLRKENIRLANNITALENYAKQCKLQSEKRIDRT